MIEIIAGKDGEPSESLGVFDSVQMTGDDLRDPDGNVILHAYSDEPGDMVWFDQTGNGWYDWKASVR